MIDTKNGCFVFGATQWTLVGGAEKALTKVIEKVAKEDEKDLKEKKKHRIHGSLKAAIVVCVFFAFEGRSVTSKHTNSDCESHT